MLSFIIARIYKLAIFIFFATLLQGCSSLANRSATHQANDEKLRYNTDDFLRPTSSTHYQKSSTLLWKKNLNAHLSHVTLNEDGTKLLASISSPNKVLLYSAKGKLLFSRNLPQPIRAQALNATGNLAAVSSYDGTLRVYQNNGKLLWQKERFGKPVFLNEENKVLLIQDDDANENADFILYDLKGNQIFNASVDKNWGESIDTILAENEKSISVITRKNWIITFDLTGKVIHKFNTNDNIAGLTIQSYPRQVYYALSYRDHQRWLTAYDSEAKVLWRNEIKYYFENIKFIAGQIFLYGNTQHGQAYCGFDAVSGKELWHASYGFATSYSSQMQVAMVERQKPQPFMSVIVDNAEEAGVLAIAGIAAKKILWQIPVRANSGIYSFSVSDINNRVAVATGDPGNGLIEYYSIQNIRE